MTTALMQHSVNDLTTMAEAVAQSGLFGMKSWQQALALMLVAQSEGVHPATITQDYDIIQGKACRKTHSVMARFQQMGGKVEWHELTNLIADATFSHPAGGSLRIEWSFEQAKKAGLTNKDNWKNYPRAMLRARVIAEGVRSVYPAAIGGMMVAEEAQDIPASSPSPLSVKQTRDPQIAAEADLPEGYELFEEANLPALRDAALNGIEALQEARSAIKPSSQQEKDCKAKLWTLHGDKLKSAAIAAKQPITIDSETGEVV